MILAAREAQRSDRCRGEAARALIEMGQGWPKPAFLIPWGAVFCRCPPRACPFRHPGTEEIFRNIKELKVI
jgi:hypothetical protein